MSTRRSALGLMLTMGGSAALASWARPSILESDSRRGMKLENIIPESFGAWRIDRNLPVIVPPPDQQALLNKIYNQTLARTYVNDKGYRVMLSLAYGGDQSDGLNVHLPEVCYVGQGFKLESSQDGQMLVGGLVIPVRRLVTSVGPRHEPITYWVTHGNEATISAWRRREVSIRYGLQRRIPDGILVRASSIDRLNSQAYDMQAKFLVELAAAMKPSDRDLLVGNVSLVPAQ